MRYVHEAALVADRAGGVVRAHAERDPLGEEQADELARVRAHLLADDDGAGKLAAQLLGAADRVVVGDRQHVDAARAHAGLELVGRRRRVARPHRVAVEVDRIASAMALAESTNWRYLGDGRIRTSVPPERVGQVARSRARPMYTAGPTRRPSAEAR